MARTSTQHDAHVRARRGLLTRIVDRWREWGAPRFKDYDMGQRVLTRYAASALARHTWREGWAVKWGKYYPFASRRAAGQYADVPTTEIHQIMCSALGEYNRRARERRQSGSVAP